MPIPSPFHPRTQPLCVTYRWKDWAGYHAPCAYGLSPEREYAAIRHASALFDVTPLFKYDIGGAGAVAFLSRVTVRDVATLAPGRVTYLCLCDDEGKVIDDGTCAHLGEGRFRLTSASPVLHWLEQHARPFDVVIHDRSRELAALALQGPTSRDLLRQVCDADLDALRYFGVSATRFREGEGWLSRTGYSGDLGYELWVPNEHALGLWDAITAAGKSYGLEPVGLDALDVARIEAGFVLRGIDYHGANEALTDAQKSTPFELGLGWTVTLDGRGFIGEAALARERHAGARLALCGLDIDWPAIEALYAEHELPPVVPVAAWRTPAPIYFEGRQVGRATSGAWSPILKRNLALATVEADVAAPGTTLFIEWTVEYARKTVPAKVVPRPFFDPERKRA